MKYYMVFDGRYHFDPDTACVLECTGESDNEKDVINEFKQDYTEFDAVLVSYDQGEDNTLLNATVVC